MIAPLYVLAGLLPWFGDAGGAPPAFNQAARDNATSPITRMVRQYVALNDKAIFGDANALSALASMQRDVERDITERCAEIGETAELSDEELLFAISSGGSSLLRSALSNGRIGKSRIEVARWAAAALDKNKETAKPLFAKIDLKSLKNGLRYQLMLIEAELLADEPSLSIPLLEDIRMGVPGGALEEAALRLEITALFRDGRISHGLARLSGYIRRYRQSSYWSAYSLEMAKHAAAIASITAQQLVDAGSGLVGESGDIYHGFLLAAVKEMVRTGRFSDARLIAAFVEKSASVGTPSWRQANMYRLICESSSAASAMATAALRDLPLESFVPEEQQLIKAAIGVADDIDEGYVGLSANAPAQPSSNSKDVAERGSADNISAQVDSAIKNANDSMASQQ